MPYECHVNQPKLLLLEVKIKFAHCYSNSFPFLPSFSPSCLLSSPHSNLSPSQSSFLLFLLQNFMDLYCSQTSNYYFFRRYSYVVNMQKIINIHITTHSKRIQLQQCFVLYCRCHDIYVGCSCQMIYHSLSATDSETP